MDIECSLCGNIVDSKEIASRENRRPVCVDCVAAREEQEEREDYARTERRRHRRLSRQERLEGLADSGIDTWEEYRGER